MEIDRRQVLAGTAAAGLMMAACGSAAQSAWITPEAFGAVGDGRTNDSAAFAALSAFVNARGGGQIALRPTTYLVGGNHPVADGQYAFTPATIMHFIGCAGPLTIQGNGARLLCEPGLRFGTFDRHTAQPTHHSMPYRGRGDLASPYFAMIRVQTCSGAVEITDVELDGNLQRLRIGGTWGDRGRQIPATGIQLFDNSGPERLARIRSHHHALDGITIRGALDRSSSSSIEALVCEYNGRQGCSISGGRNYAFNGCSFNRTARAGVFSPPGAGVDIEPGSVPVRALQFTGCEFVDNRGVGLLADSGDTEGVTFERCRFVGSTSWSAWPKKPGFKFDDCTFVGALVHAFGDPDPRRACQFLRCTLTDDPALSPMEKVYGIDPSRPIADLPNSRNVRFGDCRFQALHGALLPWSTADVIYSDCEMSQTSPRTSHPRGTFLGHNVITGNAILDGSKIEGEVILNGRRVPAGP